FRLQVQRRTSLVTREPASKACSAPLCRWLVKVTTLELQPLCHAVLIRSWSEASPASGAKGDKGCREEPCKEKVKQSGRDHTRYESTNYRTQGGENLQIERSPDV